MTKLCNKCKIEKPVEAFNKNTMGKYGRAGSCKSCKSLWRKANADSIKQQKKTWCNANKERIAKNKAEYYKTNKTRLDSYKKEWNTRNPDKVKQYEAATATNFKNSPEMQATRKRYIESNKAAIATTKKNNKHKRRAQECVGVSTNELRLWEAAQLKVCAYCGNFCNEDYHIDHITPLSTGGEHELVNLTISCPSCNCTKSATPLLTFLAKQRNKQ